MAELTPTPTIRDGGPGVRVFTVSGGACGADDVITFPLGETVLDSVEYGEVEYVISTGAVVETVTGTIRTTPAVATMTVDLPLYANAVPTAQDIGSRTALFYLGRSGVVSGELAGLFWATLAPGDVVSLTSSWMKDPLSTDYSLTAKRCIVLAAVPDIERARVAVTLKIPTEA